MFKWTPDEILRALDLRDRTALRALVAHLSACIVAGRAYFFHKYPGFLARIKNKEDDVQQVLAVLFDDRPPPDARLLRKFGQTPGFVWREGALKAYVMGVTFNVLRRAYQKRGGAREHNLEDDLAMLDDRSDTSPPRPPTSEVDLALDLVRACAALSLSDRELFDLLYVKQLETGQTCAHLGITSDVLHARKSRLLKRLKSFLAGDPHE
jgi:DNA-directed RNA polymerase specialized sigma24 family protein